MCPRLSSLALAAAVGLASLSGCESCHRRETTAAQPYCASCAGCVDGIQPPRMAPVPIPVDPASPPAPYLAPAPPPRPPAAGLGTPVPAPASPDAGAPPPPAGEAPPPVEPAPSVRRPSPGPLRRDSARPPADATREPPVASVPPQPAASEERETPAAIDIPGFAVARPNVATGLRPFPEGIDWLKAHGYKNVLHLLPPGEKDKTDRDMFEKKGLRYIVLDASPARLDRELYDRFNKLVTDPKNQPLFVYDRDGSVLGGLWYLHFRVYLKQSDEKARANAQRLGLRFDDDIEHKTMWLAVQTLLKTLSP